MCLPFFLNLAGAIFSNLAGAAQGESRIANWLFGTEVELLPIDIAAKAAFISLGPENSTVSSRLDDSRVKDQAAVST